MKRKFLILPLLIFLSGCWGLYYDAQTLWLKSAYIEKSNINKIELSPMPKESSPKDIADINAVLDWQNKRTEQDCHKAVFQAKAGYEVFFGDLNLEGAKTKDFFDFAEKIKNDTWLAMGILKSRYDRKRPYNRDNRISPCLKKKGGLAYPSGHSALTYIYAFVLSDLYPHRKAELFKRAQENAMLRVIGGVHHPSDIEAGRELAEKLYKEFLKNDKFKKDFEKIKEKLKSANQAK